MLIVLFAYRFRALLATLIAMGTPPMAAKFNCLQIPSTATFATIPAHHLMWDHLDGLLAPVAFAE